MSTQVRWFAKVAAILGVAGSAFAWTPQPTTPWQDGTIAVALEFQANVPPPPPLGPVDWTAVAREALQLWSAQLERSQLLVIPAAGQPAFDNGRNEVYFGASYHGREFGRGVLAVTITSIDGDERLESDIVVNSGEYWDVYPGVPQIRHDFRRVVMHELGHLLGLDHPDEAKPAQTVTALMNAHVSDVESLQADDIAGARALYNRAITTPPVIIWQPAVESTEACEGKWAVLHVAAGGRGPFAYTWRRDGVPLATGPSLRSLELDPLKTSDAGTYTVEVANAAGATLSAPVRLDVRAAKPPAVANVFVRETRVESGTWVRVETDVLSGDTPMVYTWYRDDIEVGTTRVDELILERIQFSDAGEYSVEVSNVAGTTRQTVARLKVLPASPPRFDDAGWTTAPRLGEMLTLGSSVHGTGTLAFQWFKDGVAVPGATAPQLSMANYGSDQAGAYTLVATNAVGTVRSDPIVLRPPEPTPPPPAIVRHPASAREYLGGGVELSFEQEIPPASSSLGRTVTWFRDGMKIEGAHNERLIVAPLRPEDAGSYHVEVSQGGVTTRSRAAVVTVISPVPDPVFSWHPAPHTVTVGTWVNLSASIAAMSPSGTRIVPSKLRVEWLRDDVVVRSGEGSTFDSLTHGFSADTGRAGVYRVRVARPGGPWVTSLPASVDVLPESPLLTVHPRSRTYPLEDSHPTPVREALMTEQLLAQRGFDHAGFELVEASGPAVAGVTPGTYVLKVRKGAAQASSKIFTIAFRPTPEPFLSAQPEDQSVELGQAATWRVTADHASAYQWLKDGTPIPGATGWQFTLPIVGEKDLGRYAVQVSGPSGTLTSAGALLERMAPAAPVVRSHPSSQLKPAGAAAVFAVTATGGNLRYQWYKDGAVLPGATDRTLSLSAVAMTDSGLYQVVVANETGTTSSFEARLRVEPVASVPHVLRAPQDEAAALGGDVVLQVGATGVPLPTSYQWQKDGVDIPGANDVELRLRGVQPSDAGHYRVVVTNEHGATISPASNVTVDARGRLVNLGTRTRVGRGDSVLIAGFVVSGTSPRQVLVRGVGATLAEYGVGGVLRNPVLEVFDAKSRRVAINDDWTQGEGAGGPEFTRARVAAMRETERAVGAFPLRQGASDCALIVSLEPGSYTAKIAGYMNATGVALVEVYEVGRPAATRLVNLSARSWVGRGDEVLIPSMVVAGLSPRRFLIRAIGPRLADFNVAGVLADPRLTIYRGSTAIGTNDDWEEQGAGPAVTAAGAMVGAFPLLPGSADAAVVVSLEPGNYSVHVSGANDGTGVALVEVYELPD